jgi:hypothetical protein
MPSGELVDTRQVGLESFESWRTRCNKPTCRKCPHGPYWYKVSYSSGRRRLLYVGVRLPKEVDETSDKVRQPKSPWRCDCGSVLSDFDRLARSCRKCKVELDGQGYLVRCAGCKSGLRRNRLDSDPCHTCGSYDLPRASHEDRVIRTLGVTGSKSAVQVLK